MVKIVSKRLSILHIHMGEIIVEVSRIYDEDRSKIDREILDKVAKARFGEGNYELKDRDTYWRLESPSPLTQEDVDEVNQAQKAKLETNGTS